MVITHDYTIHKYTVCRLVGTPTCCWDVVVTIRVLERRAQWAAKMFILTFSSHFEGKERPETSQEVNKWRRSSEEEVTIKRE